MKAMVMTEKMPAMKEGETRGPSSMLVAHGNGTYAVRHGEHMEEKTDHPSIGSALMHMASMHSEGPQMHIHGKEEGYEVHSMDDKGKTSGPQMHGTKRSLNNAVGDCMDCEQ